ncbi:MAG: hypothetical protein GTN76_07940 [Candidatus Aenigmarchaeota archaeon]|nr:hypothetical protein [Candidatus Aenigmarchaeota archaeon]
MKIFGKSEKDKQPPKPPKPPVPSKQARPGADTGPSRVRLPPLKISQPESSPEGSPPLFIKVDKYRDVIRNMRNLRSYILNLRDALDVLEDIQKELANGVHIAQKTLDELNVILSSLDSFFLKPNIVEHEEREEKIEHEEYRPRHPEAPAPREVEGYVRDVYGELERLRNQLRSIS